MNKKSISITNQIHREEKKISEHNAKISQLYQDLFKNCHKDIINFVEKETGEKVIAMELGERETCYWVLNIYVDSESYCRLDRGYMVGSTTLDNFSFLNKVVSMIVVDGNMGDSLNVIEYVKKNEISWVKE
jgi:hypothetical protein